MDELLQVSYYVTHDQLNAYGNVMGLKSKDTSFSFARTDPAWKKGSVMLSSENNYTTETFVGV